MNSYLQQDVVTSLNFDPCALGQLLSNTTRAPGEQ